MFPFILLIGLAVYAGSRYAAAQAAEIRVAGALPPAPPGPIAVLGEMLKRGQQPPPPIIMCAIAEAEAIGRNDLACDIVRVFIAPVVYQHEIAQARNANVGGSIASPPPPPSYAPPPPPPTMPGYPPNYTMNPQANMDRARAAREQAMAYSSAPRADEPLPMPVQATPVAQPMPGAIGAPGGMQPAPGQPTDEELIAQMLGQPPPAKAAPAQAPASPASVAVVTSGEVSFQDVSLERERVRVPMRNRPRPNVKAHEVTVLDSNGRPVGPRYAPPSPIAEIDDDTWAAFADRIARESPIYQSSRHVGQYRQRKERLAELGIDPGTLVGVEAAQRAAFDIDMADAYRHAREGGMIGENLRRLISVPGVRDACTVTLSGILGVIQVAGLEAAYGWFEDQRDRKKYTYTTKMFLHTNGAF